MATGFSDKYRGNYYLKQKHLRCKKVQGQSEAAIIDQKFDIMLRPRSLEYNK